MNDGLASLDRRNRSLEDLELISIERLCDEIGSQLATENGEFAASAQATLGLPPLVIKVEDKCCTFDRGTIRLGDHPVGALVEADQEASSDLFNRLRSIYGLLFGGGNGKVSSGELNTVLAWDQVLEALFDG